MILDKRPESTPERDPVNIAYVLLEVATEHGASVYTVGSPLKVTMCKVLTQGT